MWDDRRGNRAFLPLRSFFFFWSLSCVAYNLDATEKRRSLLAYYCTGGELILRAVCISFLILISSILSTTTTPIRTFFLFFAATFFFPIEAQAMIPLLYLVEKKVDDDNDNY